MTHLARLADLVIGQPLLITPEKLDVILGVLGPRIGLPGFGTVDAEIESDATILVPESTSSRFAGDRSSRGPYRIDKGIALIPVIGSLVNRGAYIGASSGLTSYEGLTEQLKKASLDSEVRGILLDMNTPGGEALGCFELAEFIREIREKKPVVAMVNSMAASAGYAIASACNQIYTTSTGILGSIGVVMAHFDRSGQMEQEGIKVTLIHAGAKKVDGHPFGPLPKNVKSEMQAELESLREKFIASVIAGRPKLKADDVKATEAGVFMGEAAVENGLADGVSTFDRVIEAMHASTTKLPAPPAGYDVKPKEKAMTDAPAAEAASVPDQAALDAARAEGVVTGRTEEKKRLGAILALSEAAGRGELALELAIGTDLTPEACAKTLAKASKEAPPTTKIYDAVAAAGGNPRVPLVGDDHKSKTRAQLNIERQSKRLTAGA